MMDTSDKSILHIVKIGPEHYLAYTLAVPDAVTPSPPPAPDPAPSRPPPPTGGD
ncbi:hypothetical protein HZU77_003070 [Neisseriaceae bacterium TC5R-5]|nr:hypothetical protein [Neisseriaceae bacterium TC5R-5]